MVKLNDFGDLLEALLELSNLLEMITELDNGCRLKHPLLVDDELTMLDAVDVGLDEEKVRAALDGQESASRNVDTMAVLEELDSVTGGGLELKDSLAIVSRLGVDDNVELHLSRLHDPLEC